MCLSNIIFLTLFPSKNDHKIFGSRALVVFFSMIFPSSEIVKTKSDRIGTYAHM